MACRATPLAFIGLQDLTIIAFIVIAAIGGWSGPVCEDFAAQKRDRRDGGVCWKSVSALYAWQWTTNS